MGDTSPLDFLKRRIRRLYPTYIPFTSFYLIYQTIFCGSQVKVLVGNIFAIQGLTSNGGEFNWFLTGIKIAYLLTPYLASYVSRLISWFLLKMENSGGVSVGDNRVFKLLNTIGNCSFEVFLFHIFCFLLQIK